MAAAGLEATGAAFTAAETLTVGAGVDGAAAFSSFFSATLGLEPKPKNPSVRGFAGTDGAVLLATVVVTFAGVTAAGFTTGAAGGGTVFFSGGFEFKNPKNPPETAGAGGEILVVTGAVATGFVATAGLAVAEEVEAAGLEAVTGAGLAIAGLVATAAPTFSSFLVAGTDGDPKENKLKVEVAGAVVETALGTGAAVFAGAAVTAAFLAGSETEEAGEDGVEDRKLKSPPVGGTEVGGVDFTGATVAGLATAVLGAAGTVALGAAGTVALGAAGTVALGAAGTTEVVLVDGTAGAAGVGFRKEKKPPEAAAGGTAAGAGGVDGVTFATAAFTGAGGAALGTAGVGGEGTGLATGAGGA